MALSRVPAAHGAVLYLFQEQFVVRVRRWLLRHLLHKTTRTHVDKMS
ncbi:hypothetical protein [Salinicola tamaricis]|nr:hypothetical protein [Salinicola tamaricis]